MGYNIRMKLGLGFITLISGEGIEIQGAGPTSMQEVGGLRGKRVLVQSM